MLAPTPEYVPGGCLLHRSVPVELSFHTVNSPPPAIGSGEDPVIKIFPVVSRAIAVMEKVPPRRPTLTAHTAFPPASYLTAKTCPQSGLPTGVSVTPAPKLIGPVSGLSAPVT